MALNSLACRTDRRLPLVLLAIAVCIFWDGLALADPPGNTATGPTFNLADFKPAADGVTDDGPAFQQAIDAIAQAGGGTLFVPAGKYLIATPVSKDFAGIDGPVIIQGVPSSQMPAPPSAAGQDLAAGLNLPTDITPATGNLNSAFTFKNIKRFLIEHIGFSGRPTQETDAFVTLNLLDVEDATIRHCEFYGLSSMGGGNIVRAEHSSLSIELSVFLGCTANSGGYAPTVENIEWLRFSISNSIFLDYGLRPLFGKTGLGSPFSWINVAKAADPTPESPRRELIVRDVFLDEGGWIGLTATPHRWGNTRPIDLVYVTGLKMNVSNFATCGHAFFDVRDVLIENSHYGYSKNASAAIDIYRVNHAIYDKLTLVADATRLHTDNRTQRLTVINSPYETLDSEAQTTTVLETAPEDDPVQFVRKRFFDVLGKAPDPAAHFYWSDLLIRCGQDSECLDQVRSNLTQYLSSNPVSTFTLTGTLLDEHGKVISGGIVNMTGSFNFTVLTDSEGRFRFSNLPTSGSYTVAVSKTHFTFAPDAQTFLNPAGDQNVIFNGTWNRHTISGRIVTEDGQALPGVTVTLDQTTSSVTNEDGNYSFPGLLEAKNYSVVPTLVDFAFTPASKSFENLVANQTADFVSKPSPKILTVEGTDVALALESVMFMAEPFSLLNELGFSVDGTTRVMVFVTNLDVSDVAQLSAALEDESGDTYPVTIEHLHSVPELGWLKQLNLKLPHNISSGNELKLRISTAEGSSNTVRLRVMPDQE